MTALAKIDPLPHGKHKFAIAFKARPFGAPKFKVEDVIAETSVDLICIPRDNNDDYSEAIVIKRQRKAPYAPPEIA